MTSWQRGGGQDDDIAELRLEIQALKSSEARTHRDVKECRVSVSDVEALLRGEMQRMGGALADHERSLEYRLEQTRAIQADQEQRFQRELAQVGQRMDTSLAKQAAEQDAKVAALQDRLHETSRHVSELMRTTEDLRTITQQRFTELDRCIADVRAESQAANREMDDRIRRELMQIAGLRQEITSVESACARNTGEIKDVRSTLSDVDSALRGEIYKVASQAEAAVAANRTLILDAEKGLERSMATLRAAEEEHRARLAASVREVADQAADQASALKAALALQRDELEMQVGDVEAQARDQVEQAAQVLRLELQTLRDRTVAVDLRVAASEASMQDLDARLQRELSTVMREDQARDQQTRDALGERIDGVERRLADCAQVRDEQHSQLHSSVQQLDSRLERELAQLSRDVDARSAEHGRAVQAKLSEVEDVMRREATTLSTRLEARYSELSSTEMADRAQLRSNIQTVEDQLQRELAQFGRDADSRDRALRDLLLDQERASERGLAAVRAELADMRAKEMRELVDGVERGRAALQTAMKDIEDQMKKEIAQRDTAVRGVLQEFRDSTERRSDDQAGAIEGCRLQCDASIKDVDDQMKKEILQRDSAVRGLFQEFRDSTERRFGDQTAAIEAGKSQCNGAIQALDNRMHQDYQRALSESEAREKAALDMVKLNERTLELGIDRLRDEATEQKAAAQVRLREFEDLVRREDDQIRAQIEKRYGEFASLPEQIRAEQRTAQQEQSALYERHLQEVARDIENRERSQLELLRDHERGMERSISALRDDFQELSHLASFQQESERLNGEICKVRAALDARFADVCEAHETTKSMIAHMPAKLMAQLEEEFQGFRTELRSKISAFEHTLADQGAKLGETVKRNEEMVESQVQHTEAALHDMDEGMRRMLTRASDDTHKVLDDQRASLGAAFENLQRDLGDRVHGLEARAEDGAKAQDLLSKHIDDLDASLGTSVADLDNRLRREMSRELASIEDVRRLEQQLKADLAGLQAELRGVGDRLGGQQSALAADLNAIRSGVQSQDDRLQHDNQELRALVTTLESEVKPLMRSLEDRHATNDRALRDIAESASTGDRALRDLIQDTDGHLTRSIDTVRSQVIDDAAHMLASFGELKSQLNVSMAQVTDTCQGGIRTFEQRLKNQDDQLKTQFSALGGEIEMRYKASHDSMEAATAGMDKRFDAMKAGLEARVDAAKASLTEDNQKTNDNLQNITYTLDGRFQEERSSASELRSAAEAAAIQRGQDQDARLSALKQDLEAQLSRNSSQSVRTTEGLNAAQAQFRDMEQRVKMQMDQMEKTRQLLSDRVDSVDGRFREQVQVQVDTKALIFSSVQNVEDKLVRQMRDFGRSQGNGL